MRIATLGVFAASLLLAPAALAQVVFNEVLYDPAADVATGDANGNGVRESSGDEFIELVNTGTTAVDLTGFVIEDEASFASTDATFVRHTFPAGSVVQPGKAIVVFGREGATATNPGGPPPVGTFGGAIVQQSSNLGGLGLNNSNETIYLLNPAGATVATLVTDASVPQDQSYARSPDKTGAFVGHLAIPSNARTFSPGLQNTTNQPFTVTTAAGETPNGALTLAAANPIRGNAQVRFSTETAQDVRLAMFDVLGRQVATLAQGVVAGAQTATLSTAALAPGVYVLRLTAGADVLTQTVTVVR